YFVPPTSVVTPWGIMRGGSDTAQSSAPAVPNISARAAEILQQVRVDKTEVMLSSYEPAKDAIEVSNGMTGPIKLRVEYEGFPGLSIQMDKAEVDGGGRGRLLLEVNPKDKVP